MAKLISCEDGAREEEEEVEAQTLA